MQDILQEIVAFKRVEVEQQKQLVSPRDLYARVERLMAAGISARSMSRSLASSPYGIIAEFNRKSPSKAGSMRMHGLWMWCPCTQPVEHRP